MLRKFKLTFSTSALTLTSVGVIALPIELVEELLVLLLFYPFWKEELSELLLGLRSGAAELFIVLFFSLINVIMTEIFLVWMDGY